MKEQENKEREFYADPEISNSDKHRRFVESGRFGKLPAVVDPTPGLLVVTMDDTRLYEIAQVNGNGTVNIRIQHGADLNSRIISLKDVRRAKDVGNALLQLRGYNQVLEFTERDGNTYMRPKPQNN